MSNSKNSLDGIKNQYFSLSKTIRRLLISGILAVIYAVLDMAVIQPLMEEYSEVTRSIEQVKAESKGYAASLLQLQGTAGIDPTLSDKKQMEVLTIKLNEIDNAINTIKGQFVSPNQMSQFLNELLSKSGKLTLVSLKNKLPDSIMITATKTVNTDGSETDSTTEKPEASKEKTKDIIANEIYKHGVRLTFRGKYTDIATYLHDIEKLDWGIFWQSLELNSESYPYSTVSIEFYTLSLEKNWLTL